MTTKSAERAPAAGAAQPLAHQVALVTGASRGIGAGVALALARAGADVAIAARTVPDLEAVASRIEALGRRALVVPADVRDDRSVHVMVQSTLETFGRLDILVNNAGLGHFGPVDELTLEQFDEMLGVNLRGPFLCTRAVVPTMKRQGSGAILNIASVAGLVANPNLAGYNATKFGLMGLSEACMLELRHFGIKVSTICPGSTATDFAGGREATDRLTVDDVSHAILAVLTAGPGALISQVHLRPLHPPRR
ncbi:MAG: SDR family NAD(P)-dependent oxidoreductase [Candidatus Eisenbacteria bacterium]